ncbi:hypothetical protein ACO0M4_32435 [Streptomyces sp. RGM 3693]|uniref:hypothetical protein n=1 Tax=Streptomyces sp. RGM 3693 TaxID=3413284 RepID=UPI003D2D3271
MEISFGAGHFAAADGGASGPLHTAIRHHHRSPTAQTAQTAQTWCLTLLTNSVVTWTTEYYGLAIAQMHAEAAQSTTNSSHTTPRPTART